MILKRAMKLFAWFLVAMIMYPWARASSQTSVVDFSIFTMGASVVPTGTGSMTIVVGQPLVEDVQLGNLRLESGFVNNILLGSGISITAAKPESVLVGVSVPLGFRLPPGLTTSAESLYYRKGGERTFSSVSVQRVGDSIAATIPAGASTLRGIEYYLAFFSSVGYQRFPQSGVDTIRVRFLQFASPLTLDPGRYRMISVPADLAGSDVQSVLEDDLGPYDPSRWRLFRWEQGRYVEHPALAAQLTPGNAFWLITRAGGGFDVDDGRSVSSLSAQTIRLDTGWNQIASPFAFPIDWGERIANVDVSPAYFYDGTQYQLNITILNPWEGYFVENRTGSPLAILVPPVEAVPNLSGSPLPTSKDDEGYVLQLSAASQPGGFLDTYNFVGFKAHARTGLDRFDLREPPAVGEFIRLSISDGGLFASNFKPFPQEGEEWRLVISSSLPGQDVSVQIAEEGTLPEGFAIHVLDCDEFAPLSIQNGSFHIQTHEARSSRSLKLIIGTEQFAELHSGGIPLVPLSYALDQNYPNPFNPATTIRYQLSKRSRVNLEVFDLLGRKVKTLVREEQVTGVHTVQWNGTNDAGTPVASGMYVVRLRAGEFVAPRKMLLLR